VYTRENLAAGATVSGPALITETVSTTFLAAGWLAELHETGSLLLARLSG